MARREHTATLQARQNGGVGVRRGFGEDTREPRVSAERKGADLRSRRYALGAKKKRRILEPLLCRFIYNSGSHAGFRLWERREFDSHH